MGAFPSFKKILSSPSKCTKKSIWPKVVTKFQKSQKMMFMEVVFRFWKAIFLVSLGIDFLSLSKFLLLQFTFEIRQILLASKICVRKSCFIPRGKSLSRGTRWQGSIFPIDGVKAWRVAVPLAEYRSGGRGRGTRRWSTRQIQAHGVENFFGKRETFLVFIRKWRRSRQHRRGWWFGRRILERKTLSLECQILPGLRYLHRAVDLFLVGDLATRHDVDAFLTPQLTDARRQAGTHAYDTDATTSTATGALKSIIKNSRSSANWTIIENSIALNFCSSKKNFQVFLLLMNRVLM